MIVFRNIFCYAGWKSLYIPIAIIKLSGLNVFIYSVEGVGPINVRPSVLIDFPICNICICIPLRTWFVQTGCVVSAFTYGADKARMAGKHQQPDLPSWYCCTFTNCTVKFSHWWMTWCIVVRLSLVIWSVCAFMRSGAWLWTAICREGGAFAFSAIRLKLAFSKIPYCTFK